MTLEEQCVNLELAKRLKELGVKQESYFYHSNFYLDVWKLWHPTTTTGDRDGPSEIQLLKIQQEKDRAYSAFTCTELGELLPDFIEHPDEDDQIIQLNCSKSCFWNVTYTWDHFKNIEDEILSNAMAKMLIYLIENKFMELNND